MGILTALILLTAPPQATPTPRLTVIASASADTALPQDPFVRHDELLRLERDDAAARLWMPAQGWNALLGDVDLDGSFDVPAGVDGLAWAPRGGGTAPSLLDFWFTTDSDFLGWKDGDVLRLHPSGAIELVLAEDVFRTALGTASALDLDALARDDDGRLYFSLRDGITASVLGPIEDGDVLLYDPIGGGVTRPWTEGDVQAWVDLAAPGSGPLGDVKSLAFDPETGALLFTVQSPTPHDATVFSNAQGGTILRGFEEGDFGFLASTELDALEAVNVALAQHPLLLADETRVAPGQSVTLRIRHATPHAILHGIASNRRAPKPSVRGGFGIAVPDLTAAVRAWPLPGGQLTADAHGNASASLTAPQLPAGATHVDLYLQIWDGAAGGLATPCVVRVE